MNRFLAALCLAVVLTGCGQSSSGKLGTQNEKRSYALGLDIGKSLRDVPIDLQLDSLSQGIKDAINGEPKLSDKQLKTVMNDFIGDLKQAREKTQAANAKTNEKKGEKFLAANKKKDGVKVTKSGLQYKVLKAGDGPTPGANDRVTVQYVGKLIDGTVFDSSKKRGKPVTFPVSAVIPGWTEGLQLMKQGAKYRLFIPPKLAYGKRGAGGAIGPNQTLIFDVDLLKVAKKAENGKSDKKGESDKKSDKQG